MSYDLVLCSPRDDHRYGEEEEEAELDDAARALAESLVRFRPSLHSFTAARYIELSDEPLGLQITVSNKSVSMTLAYWHDGHAADAAFRAVWDYAGYIESQVPYVTYDAQTDAVVDLRSESQRKEAVARDRGKHARSTPLVEVLVALRRES